MTAGRLRLDRHPATAGSGYFPPAGPGPAFASRGKIAASGRPTLRCGLSGAVSIAPGPYTAIEAAVGAARANRKEQIMAVIGEFATNGNNSIVGNVRTLTVSMRARLNPIDRVSRDAPDFRITAGNGVEVGAGWNKVSNDGEPFISVKLDDPSFNAPITAALWPSEKEGEFALIWNRPKREA
ncbi:conserved hypothetical protein [Agrobacterium tumefaciens str. Kerr 14]|uniref:DUF736 domain-containing protein n=2 Tax=Agrobacterium tumefaciens TaxID=358 RepID=A0A1S7SFS3_AGRTU|nr:conserved hypothetical protein [Agrobacterium tumefaciens str. Kerr 14]